MSRFKVTFDDNTEYLVDAPDEAEVKAHCATPSAAKRNGVALQADGTRPPKKIKTVVKVK